MRVLFATAELAPFVKVGGLGDFSAGLVSSLRARGVQVVVALPDYGGLPFTGANPRPLTVPDWAAPASVRRGSLNGFGPVALVSVPNMIRPHPYTDADGEGWADNDYRFFAFSAAVAALAVETAPDVLHLNDWHTGASLGFLPDPVASILTIHNLAYQGVCGSGWLSIIPRRAGAYEWYGSTNPLTGAIALADRVVTVSPTFAAESLRAETGFGLDVALSARGAQFMGILNGIDTNVWDPATDPHLPIHYDEATAGKKRELARRLSQQVGWTAGTGPIIGMVSRLTGQKGVDIALELTADLDKLGARMVMLGSGERWLADAARRLGGSPGGRFVFREGYDESLAHLIFGASDLYLMPSRFEPAGLTQMQAMRYGSIPVVTDVGGLHDTVTDADENPDEGTGFVAAEVSAAAVGEALARAVRAWRSTRRRGEIRRRGMSADWSWDRPAQLYIDLYEDVMSAR